MNGPAEGIKGPGGMGTTDVLVGMPNCIQIKSQKDSDEFRDFVSKVVQASHNNAIEQLKILLGDQAPELIEHLKKRLNVK